jgi:putative ubiquitin-RnfH superfamily antitoxin RatB of RatAB toxin-antitoxin module
MESAERILVEVAYARPDQQVIVEVNMPPDTTIEKAIRMSGILENFPEIDLGKNKVGIFGRLAKLDDVPKDQDRIEIYRPLIADPKEVRRRRAAEGKAMKKGGGDLPAA